jgi:ammonium transporter Rh
MVKVHKSSRFFLTALSLELAVFVLFVFFVRYKGTIDPVLEVPASIDVNGTIVTDAIVSAQSTYTYPLFQDVHVMIFVGFGFLMTFLRRYGFSAVGYNLLIAAFAIQWAVLCRGFWHRVHLQHWEKIEIVIPELVSLDFAAGSVLIAFGAVLGKTSPTQLLVMCFMQVFFYSLNEMIIVRSISPSSSSAHTRRVQYNEFRVADIGGSTVIHEFGAYFGLAVSYMITNKRMRDHPDAISDATSDRFAMIGTLFLWMVRCAHAHVTFSARRSFATPMLHTVLAVVQFGARRWSCSSPCHHQHVLFAGSLRSLCLCF